jgi:hypothetical protein
MTLPFLYQNVTVVDRELHRAKRLKPIEAPFRFAAGTHFVPAVLPEFVPSCRELPILFLTTPEGSSPVFVTGATGQRNAFVRPDGTWSTTYVPAYLRRYPFIAGNAKDGSQLVCIDATWPGFQDETGVPLFTPAGEPGEALQSIMRLVADYGAAAQASLAFAKALQELNLFRSVTVDVRDADGANATFHGFVSIDEERLNALTDAQFRELRKAGYLPAIYAQLISLGNLQRLSAPPAG